MLKVLPGLGTHCNTLISITDQNHQTLSDFVFFFLFVLLTLAALSPSQQQGILLNLFALQLLSQCFEFNTKHFDFSFADNRPAGERTVRERVGERMFLEY